MCGRERPLRLFEVLTRNRQSALGRSTPYEKRTRTTTPNVYNTSSTTTVHYQTVGDTRRRVARARIRIRIRIRRITSCNNTHTERDSIIIAHLFFFSKCTSSRHHPTQKTKPIITTTLPLCQYAQLFTFFHTLIVSHQLTIFVYSCY